MVNCTTRELFYPEFKERIVFLDPVQYFAQHRPASHLCQLLVTFDMNLGDGAAVGSLCAVGGRLCDITILTDPDKERMGPIVRVTGTEGHVGENSHCDS